MTDPVDPHRAAHAPKSATVSEDDPPMPNVLGCNRAGWLAVAGSLERQGNERLAGFIRAGLAFAPRPDATDPDADVSLVLTVEQAAIVRVAAAAIAVDLAVEETSVDEAQKRAVAAACAIIRAHRGRLPG